MRHFKKGGSANEGNRVGRGGHQLYFLTYMKAGALSSLVLCSSLRGRTWSSETRGMGHPWHLGLMLQVPVKEFQGHAVSEQESLTYPHTFLCQEGPGIL